MSNDQSKLQDILLSLNDLSFQELVAVYNRCTTLTIAKLNHSNETIQKFFRGEGNASDGPKHTTR